MDSNEDLAAICGKGGASTGVLRRIVWDPNFCAVGTQGFEHTSRRGAEECRLAAGSGPEAELEQPAEP